MEKERRCQRCGAILSQYNPEKICFCHQEFRESLRARFELKDIAYFPNRVIGTDNCGVRRKGIKLGR